MAAAIGELSSEENMLSVFFHVLASPIVYFYSIPTPKILNGADSTEGTSAPLGCCSNCLSSLGKSSQICPVMRCSRHLSFQSPWPSRLTITHLTSPGNGLVMWQSRGTMLGTSRTFVSLTDEQSSVLLVLLGQPAPCRSKSVSQSCLLNRSSQEHSREPQVGTLIKYKNRKMAWSQKMTVFCPIRFSTAWAAHCAEWLSPSSSSCPPEGRRPPSHQ